MTEKGQAILALALSTLAFAVCFACWLIYGVLITYLTDAQVYSFSRSQIGWLMGLPVLSGSLTRLPVGILTDRYGGRAVFSALMLVSAIPMYLTSYADGYVEFLLAGLGFGLTGASFSVGVAYVSTWFSRDRIGTALGVFGTGNTGAAVTNALGPVLLVRLTRGGENPEGWRHLPRLYAASLVIMAILFFALARARQAAPAAAALTLAGRLAPLRSLRVWRFGLYYFVVFGGFVALSQWMIPYYVNAYSLSVPTAGILAAAFSFPCGATRALGGWMSDRWGARTMMYWVFASIGLGCILLTVPRMDIQSPGEGVMATAPGLVSEVAPDHLVAGGRIYPLRQRPLEAFSRVEPGIMVFPSIQTWQEPVVKLGDTVAKKQLLARGITHITFQANVGIFTGIVLLVGLAMGIGMAAVYKHIPVYFPNAVGVTGGMVAVIGGLGGFFCPIFFGYLLRLTGLWTSCWMFLAVLTLGCLVWMHLVVRRMMKEQVPDLVHRMERQ